MQDQVYYKRYITTIITIFIVIIMFTVVLRTTVYIEYAYNTVKTYMSNRYVVLVIFYSIV